VSDFVYLALTLLSFAGLALLVGILGSRLDPDPHDSTDNDSDHGADHDADPVVDAPPAAVRR
jgi:hypothetical protein